MVLTHHSALVEAQCLCCKCLTVAESDHHEVQYYSGHRVGLENICCCKHFRTQQIYVIHFGSNNFNVNSVSI